MHQKTQRIVLSTLFVLLLSTVTLAETPVIEWTRQLGTDGEDHGWDMSTDDSGNIYITGHTSGDLDDNINQGDWDVFLAKYDANGNKLWTEQWGTSDRDSGMRLSVDGAGNAYVTGWTCGNFDGGTSVVYSDMFLTKYDTDGTKLWTKQLGIVGRGAGIGVSVDDNGNVYVSGNVDGNLDGNASMGSDILLAKYDTNGSKQWAKMYGTNQFDYGEEVLVDGCGDVYVTGFTAGGLGGNTHVGDYDMFLMKCDSDGVSLWTEQLGTTSKDIGHGLAIDDNGNAYITGWTDGSLDGNVSEGDSDVFLTKYDINGNKLWTEQLGTTNPDYGPGVSVDGNGNVYVVGYTGGDLDGNTSEGGDDIFFTKYNTDGNKLWTKQLGTTSDDWGRDMFIDSNNNAYITGFTGGALDGNVNAGGDDVFLMKVSAVPEPGTLAMLAVAAVMGLLYCWRKRG